MIRDLLHADRVLRLMSLDLGLSLKKAAMIDDDSAKLLIEAAEIMGCEIEDDDGDDGNNLIVMIGGPPDA